MTIKEDYCSFEVAKLLKEKGFDGVCRYYYPDGHTNLVSYVDCRRFDIFNNESCIAPTIQMACKWLREVHNKHCDIGYTIDLGWFFQIVDLKETVEYDYTEPKYYHTENETGFKTYEEACKAALKFTLENLI